MSARHSVVTSDRLSPNSLPEILRRGVTFLVVLVAGWIGGNMMYDANSKSKFLSGLAIVIASLYFARYASSVARRFVLARTKAVRFTKDFFTARSLGAAHSHARTIETTPLGDGEGVFSGELLEPSPWKTPEQLRRESLNEAAPALPWVTR